MSDAVSIPIACNSRSIWHLTLAALRANVLPGLVIWAVGAAVVIGYYHWPACREVLEQVGRFKQAYGLMFSIPSLALFAGVVPFVLQLLQRDAATNFSWRFFLFLLVFWGYKGAEVDGLYRLQVSMFGDNAQPTTLVAKVLFDQLIYVPIWAVPSMVMSYLWAHNGFNFKALREALGGRWYRRTILPILLPNWMVWFPAVTLIYMLPEPLQLPVQNLVACLFSCMLLFLTRHEDEVAAPLPENLSQSLSTTEGHGEPRSQTR